MHDIEPYFKWRDKYIASEDKRSPFYGRTYSEFQFTQKVYNYYIHPQWDAFGSPTLYLKILFTDYDEGYTIIELIGEWNDCLTNDVMYLKREVVDLLTPHGINKYVLICDNVLNFHGSDDCYYEEWYDDIKDAGGWIVFLNTLDHVEDEMQSMMIQNYAHFGDYFNGVNWRPLTPKAIHFAIEELISSGVKQLSY